MYKYGELGRSGLSIRGGGYKRERDIYFYRKNKRGSGVEPSKMVALVVCHGRLMRAYIEMPCILV